MSRKTCQLCAVIKTSIQRPPLLSSPGQLVAVPRVLQCNTQKITDTSNLLDNPEEKSLVIIFTLFWGGP